jgi:[pyruvate, water dikinase]-phosphate phosphotransferase / [pyruvate, water dikinase] kinase
MKRSVFFLSDRTGITAETLGHSLLTQFEGIQFESINLPFLDTVEKAQRAVVQIDRAADQDGVSPLLFSTLLNDEVREIINGSKGLMHDFFETFISPLEKELNTVSAHAIGRSHSIGTDSDYKKRIEAVNFALANDDGSTRTNYEDADIILVGVSRSGKTPTCLYLALQYGIRAANYPLTEDDDLQQGLPPMLVAHKKRLFGLTITPKRLQNIRTERMPDSKYASFNQCRVEVQEVERLYRHERIPFLDTSVVSIEEITTTIIDMFGLERRLYG